MTLLSSWRWWLVAGPTFLALHVVTWTSATAAEQNVAPAMAAPAPAPGWKNVALSSLGADIVASDSLANDTPDRLIDGVINHQLEHRWHSDTSQAHPHWLSLQFPRVMPLRRVVFHASAVDCFPTKLVIECRTPEGQSRTLVETNLTPARSVSVDLPPVTTGHLRLRLLASNGNFTNYVQLNALEVLAEVTPNEVQELARLATFPPEATASLSRGRFVTADSNGVFGRNDPNYGAADESTSPQRLTSGVWVKPGEDPRGKRWLSQMDQPHPHWAWIDLGQSCRVNRVVVRYSSLQNCPTELRGQFSPDGGVTVKDLFTAKDLIPNARKFAWEFRFPPVVADNFRLLIEKSSGNYSKKYTQLSQIEVYGEDGLVAQLPKAPSSAEGLPARILKPSVEKELQIEEREGEVELRSPWQKLVFDKNEPRVRSLGWDSVGEGHFELNLLGRKTVQGIRPYVEPAFGPALEPPKAKLVREGNVLRYGPFAMGRDLWMTWEAKVGAKTLEMAVATKAARPLAVQPGLVRLEFDAGQTPLAPFYRPGKVGFVHLPSVFHAPDCGTVLMQSVGQSAAGFRFQAAEYASGATWVHADLTPEIPQREDRLIVLPAGVRQTRITWSVETVRPLAKLTAGEPRLRHLPRCALNGLSFRPDTDLLSNSTTSIDCCFCMFEYAMVAQFLPTLPGGLEPVELLRRSVDTFIAGSAGHDVGNYGIYDPRYNTPLDTKPAMLFAAWTVIRKTGDLDQLRRWLPHLEHLANLMAETADDSDGLLRTVKSTRGGGWYDVIHDTWRSAYGNALGCQAFRYMTDLEQLARRPERAEHYAALAKRIEKAFLPTFLNSATGVLAGWKDQDGRLHDYWFPWLNGMAIVFGLVPDAQADAILDRLQAKVKEAGFTRFELGLPNCLMEIPKPDYVTADRFQHYLNGGASPCYAYWYTQALYQRNRRAEADAILWPMMRSFDAMLFNGGANLVQGHPDRQEWHTWTGQRCGGEGFLTDSYLTLNVIYTGYYGITFGPRGYEVAPWSPLKGRKAPVGLQYMGNRVDYAK